MKKATTTTKGTHGGARWGHAGRKSNTGVLGVSECKSEKRAPWFSVSYRRADGVNRTKSFSFTDTNRHIVLAQAAAWRVANHVPAVPPS